MTVSNTIPVPETTPIYIGTDGGGPDTVFIIDNLKKSENFQKLSDIKKPMKGIQWRKTRSGWRISESDDQEPESPSRTSVQNLLGKSRLVLRSRTCSYAQ